MFSKGGRIARDYVYVVTEDTSLDRIGICLHRLTDGD